MARRWTLRRGAMALLWMAVLCIGASPAPAQNVDDLAALSDQISQLYGQGRYTEAVPIAERYVALARQRHGEDHVEFAAALGSLALLYRSQGRYGEAEPLYKRSLGIREKALGPDHMEVGVSLNDLALLYNDLGRHAEAEAALRRSLGIYEKALGAEDSSVGIVVNNLAHAYNLQGKYEQAEPLYKRAIVIGEKASGPESLPVGNSLRGLGALYRAQEKYEQAEACFQRSLAIREKVLGPDHLAVAATAIELAHLYEILGKIGQAERLYRRSLAIRERLLGPDHPLVGGSLHSLGSLYNGMGKYQEAEPLYERALAIREKTLGANHPDLATSLHGLARLYQARGRTTEAERLYNRTLAIYENGLGAEHPWVVTTLASLADMHLGAHDWAKAKAAFQSGTEILIRKSLRGNDAPGQAQASNQIQNRRSLFIGLIKATHLSDPSTRDRPSAQVQSTFSTAQWAQASEAAASLAQMAARGAKGDAVLAAIVRERQDLVEEWQKRDATRGATLSQTPEKRDRAAEATNIARLASIDARIADIDKRLVSNFPDYASLARPTPLTIEEVQTQLAADEALVLFLDTTEWPTLEETYIWVVTKTETRWVRSALGTRALTRAVATLRCGLDAALWDDEDGSARCGATFKTAPQRDAADNIRSETLPFDVGRSNALYQALFGEVADLIADKHLLIVPSGPLTQLPFQVLVTEDAKPAGSDADYRTTAWLARQHAITVLPAVSSLKALRRVARPSAATRPLLGVGNPLLDGNPRERPQEAQWAKLTREKQACGGLAGPQVAGAVHASRGATRVATRSGRADLDHLRSQSPLPDTADELCTVAANLNLQPDDIMLGARATEAMLKKLSAAGRLADYRVVHFATHGTLSGEIAGSSEPGLILTPPLEQSEEDDGYLSASEVAALNLDADWVILSACNTAAGGSQGAEALSGLARAFIYAGARALLVSHWAVDSAATARLISSAVGSITRDARIGRSEALRRAMLSMIDSGGAGAHPAFWAPFIVVGEGAAAR